MHVLQEDMWFNVEVVCMRVHARVCVRGGLYSMPSTSSLLGRLVALTALLPATFERALLFLLHLSLGLCSLLHGGPSL